MFSDISWKDKAFPSKLSKSPPYTSISRISHQFLLCPKFLQPPSLAPPLPFLRHLTLSSFQWRVPQSSLSFAEFWERFFAPFCRCGGQTTAGRGDTGYENTHFPCLAQWGSPAGGTTRVRETVTLSWGLNQGDGQDNKKEGSDCRDIGSGVWSLTWAPSARVNNVG